MSYNYKTITNAPEERSRIIHPYCYWEDGFSSEEIDAICNLVSKTTLDVAKFSGSTNDSDKPEPVVDPLIRTSKVSFHSRTDQTSWIFDRLNLIIEMMNSRWYNFDINGYDRFQYSEYHGNESGHYDWHIDMFT